MPRADTVEANPHWLPIERGRDILHIPGTDGWPIVGTTLAQLNDPPGFAKRMIERYGPVFRTNSLGGRFVHLIGADANELVLFDKDKIFSSEQGWGPMINQLFPNGLMVIDGDKHRADRRLLAVAFKPEPMRVYADALNSGIRARVALWSGKTVKFYPAIKALTLDLAATSFLGVPFGPEAAMINKAFVDMVQASVAPVRTPIPGTAMGRGVAGRKYLVDYFGSEVTKRRAGNATDMFSQICRTTDDDGNYLSDAAIVDHMNFLVMAAHDTITSSATSMVMLLGQNPEWQDKLRAEMDGLGVKPGLSEAKGRDDLPYDRLGDLVLTEMAFKESLRFMTPVPSIPRRAIKAFSFGGHDFPIGTFVGINPAHVHHMPEHWPDPEKFDPMRFTPEASKGRHKYAWVPFGGGAHMCLGLHFAYMQTKILMWHLLRTHRIDLAPSSGRKWQAWPIPKPRDGLPVTITAL